LRRRTTLGVLPAFALGNYQFAAYGRRADVSCLSKPFGSYLLPSATAG